MAVKGQQGTMDGTGQHKLQHGDPIMVYGLTARPELNGLTGRLVEHDPVMHRWRVVLEDGTKKIFKVANLQLLDDDEALSTQGPSCSSVGVPGVAVERPPPGDAAAPWGGYVGPPAPASAPGPARAGRDRIPPEMLHEVLGLEAAPAEAAAQPQETAASAEASAREAPPAAEAGGEQEALRRLEGQWRLVLARLAKLEEQQAAAERRRLGAEEELRGRLAQLEAARPGAEAHGAPEAYTRLRREACRLDEVVSQLRALEVCLVEGGALSATTVQNKILRERFEVIRERSGWSSSASIKDVAAQQVVAERLAGFSGAASVVALHTALGPSGQTASNRRIRVAGQLRQLCASVGAAPTLASIRVLKDVTAHAEHLDVDPAQIAAAHAVLQRGRALSAVLASTSQEELERAVQAAERTGIDADELTQLARNSQDRIAEVQRKAAAQRRLRSAIAWVSREKTDALRRAIVEAQEVGLEHGEVQKAVEVLESYTKGSDAQHSTSLSAFLRQAKPTWSGQSLEAALAKLACVGIATVPDLHEALTHPDDHHLNERLRVSEQKVFSDETLRAFRSNLRQLS